MADNNDLSGAMEMLDEVLLLASGDPDARLLQVKVAMRQIRRNVHPVDNRGLTAEKIFKQNQAFWMSWLKYPHIGESTRYDWARFCGIDAMNIQLFLCSSKDLDSSIMKMLYFRYQTHTYQVAMATKVHAPQLGCAFVAFFYARP